MESSKFFFFRGSGRDTNTIFVSLETLDLLMCFFVAGGGSSAPLEDLGGSSSQEVSQVVGRHVTPT